MRLFPFLSFILFSLSLHAAMGSSVTIPIKEHQKFTFHNHKNHILNSMEARQYYKSIAPLNENDIRRQLTQQKYDISDVKLRDIASELVYQVYVTDPTGKDFKLFVDPSNGSILKTELIQ